MLILSKETNTGETNMEQRTFSELIEDITEVLVEYSGESLAEVAMGIFAGKSVIYDDDSIFTIEDVT